MNNMRCLISGCRARADNCMRGRSLDRLVEGGAERSKPRRTALTLPYRLCERHGKGPRACGVNSARAQPSFLATAMSLHRELCTPHRKQRAHTYRPTNFVRTDSGARKTSACKIKGHVADALHGVNVKARPVRGTYGGNLGKRLNRARLVVDALKRHHCTRTETREGIIHFSRRYSSLGVNGELFNAEATPSLAPKPAHRVKHGVMFNSARHHGSRSPLSGTLDGKVVRLSRPRGEDHLGGVGTKGGGNGFSSVLKNRARRPARGVKTRRIACARRSLKPRLSGSRPHGTASGMVEVVAHHAIVNGTRVMP